MLMSQIENKEKTANQLKPNPQASSQIYKNDFRRLATIEAICVHVSQLHRFLHSFQHPQVLSRFTTKKFLNCYLGQYTRQQFFNNCSRTGCHRSTLSASPGPLIFAVTDLDLELLILSRRQPRRKLNSVGPFSNAYTFGPTREVRRQACTQ